MLNFASASIYLCVAPTDMRKSFDGLAALAREHLKCDPLSGAWFVFRSKRGDKLKILYWDADGFAIWQKSQLSVCTHPFPFTESSERPHNLARRIAAPGGMDRDPPGRSTRR